MCERPSGLCFSPPVLPPNSCTHGSNLWALLGFSGQRRVVWKELQAVRPQRWDEGRQRGAEMTELQAGVARSAGSEALVRLMWNPDPCRPACPVWAPMSHISFLETLREAGLGFFVDGH